MFWLNFFESDRIIIYCTCTHEYCDFSLDRNQAGLGLGLEPLDILVSASFLLFGKPEYAKLNVKLRATSTNARTSNANTEIYRYIHVY